VVGGYAVNYYGYSRATADLDIWIGITPENAEAAASVVRAFGFSQAQAAAFLEPGKVIRMGVPPVRLEILTTISGVEFAAESLSTRKVFTIDRQDFETYRVRRGHRSYSIEIVS